MTNGWGLRTAWGWVEKSANGSSQPLTCYYHDRQTQLKNDHGWTRHLWLWNCLLPLKGPQDSRPESHEPSKVLVILLSLGSATFLHPCFCWVRLLPGLAWSWWPCPVLFLSATFYLFHLACSSQDVSLPASQPPPSCSPSDPKVATLSGYSGTLTHRAPPLVSSVPPHPCPVLSPLLTPACHSGPEFIPLSTKSPIPKGWVEGILQFTSPQTCLMLHGVMLLPATRPQCLNPIITCARNVG